MAQVLFFDTFFEKNPQLNSVEFPVIKDITKNYLEFKLTRIDGTVPQLNDEETHNFSFTEAERKSAAISNPVKRVIVRGQQKFKLYDVLNPIQMQINDGRILNTLKNTKTFTAS